VSERGVGGTDGGSNGCEQLATRGSGRLKGGIQVEWAPSDSRSSRGQFEKSYWLLRLAVFSRRLFGHALARALPPSKSRDKQDKDEKWSEPAIHSCLSSHFIPGDMIRRVARTSSTSQTQRSRHIQDNKGSKGNRPKESLVQSMKLRMKRIFQCPTFSQTPSSH